MIEGNEEGPDNECLQFALQTIPKFSKYLDISISYLSEFFLNHESEDYSLDEITFSSLLNLEGFQLLGFTMDFTYGDSLENLFQYRVKFNQNGFPIGFEGRPI